MDKALRASDELEKALYQKLTDIYGKAALKSVKDLKGLFADMAELEEQSPPSWMSERQAQRWRQQELDKLMQKHKAESTVMQAIMAAGVVSVPLLWGFLTDVYRENSTYTADAIKTAVKTRWKPKTQQRREVEILLKDKQPPFPKSPLTICRRLPPWSADCAMRCGRPSSTGRISRRSCGEFGM